MSEELTCGKGLAANAALPAKLAALAEALAGVLDAHLPSLDLQDADARTERDAYATIIAECRAGAERLAMASERMTGARDLPMAPHDEAALAAGPAVDSFVQYVEVECELLELLQESLRRDEEMLAMMR